MKKKHIYLSFLVFFALSSCRLEKRQENLTEGWNYNDPQNGGFEVVPFEPMETPPEMVLIEGCDFSQLKNKSLQRL